MFVYSSHNDQKYCKTRKVHSNDLKNGCTSNLRVDWARFIGKTYAQVFKTNKLAKNYLKGHSQNQTN